jgi:hypothetical protein
MQTFARPTVDQEQSQELHCSTALAFIKGEDKEEKLKVRKEVQRRRKKRERNEHNEKEQ